MTEQELKIQIALGTFDWIQFLVNEPLTAIVNTVYGITDQELLKRLLKIIR